MNCLAKPRHEAVIRVPVFGKTVQQHDGGSGAAANVMEGCSVYLCAIGNETASQRRQSRVDHRLWRQLAINGGACRQFKNCGVVGNGWRRRGLSQGNFGIAIRNKVLVKRRHAGMRIFGILCLRVSGGTQGRASAKNPNAIILTVFRFIGFLLESLLRRFKV